MEQFAVTDKHYTDLSPMQFGYEACTPSHAFGPAIRTHWLIHYIVSGKGIFRTAECTYHMGKGDMFIISPDEETYYEADACDPWEYIWIGFTAQGTLPMELPDTVCCPAARSIFEDMKHMSERGGGRTEFLCAKLWELFALLMDTRTDTVDYVDQALGLIHTEYVSGITVGRIASLLSLDRSYLSVLFKEKMGISPAAYMLTYRMNKALELMLTHRRSITVTANSVGYPDLYTFSKAFKKHFGISPRAYLAAHRAI